MEYEEARAYLEQRKQYGSRPGLESIRTLLQRLGSPEKRLPVWPAKTKDDFAGGAAVRAGDFVDCRWKKETGETEETEEIEEVPAVIQIAGTNGKGSVGAFLAQILKEAGYRVGRFTSPAVFHERETITIDGEMISEEDYARIMAQIAAQTARMDQEGIHVTVFEAETALAFFYFAENADNCDFILLEAGMGGALDATNVLSRNLLAVITSISSDHTAVLGDTLAKITAQKAGIARRGGMIVTQHQTAETERVLASICKERKIDLIYSVPVDMPLGLQGSFQRENAAVAAAAAAQLGRMGVNISEKTIAAGLLHTSWPGRLQKLHTHPDFWIDGAHNPDAAARLLESVKCLYGDRRIVLVLGMFRDKDAAAVCRILAPLAQAVFTVSLTPPRGLTAKELKEIAGKNMPGIPVTACKTTQQALEGAFACAGEDGCVLATGSLSYLKDCRFGRRQADVCLHS